MKLLDQFVSQTGRKPTEWTHQDIQKYLDYVKEHVIEVLKTQKYDN